MAQKTAEIFDLQGKATGKITLPNVFSTPLRPRRNKTRRLSDSIQQTTSKAETRWLERKPLQNHAEQAAQPQEFHASKAAVAEQLLLQAPLKEDNPIRHEQKRKS